jgi:DNA-binding NarL/FixJ family response regulator
MMSFAALLRKDTSESMASRPPVPAGEPHVAWPLATPLHVLLLDEQAIGTDWLTEVAAQTGWEITLQTADTVDAALQRLQDESFHAIVLVTASPKLCETVSLLRSSGPSEPIAVLVPDELMASWPDARDAGADELVSLSSLTATSFLATICRANERRDLLRDAARGRQTDLNSRDESTGEVLRHLSRLRDLFGDPAETPPTQALVLYRELLRDLGRSAPPAEADRAFQQLLATPMSVAALVAMHCQVVEELIRGNRVRSLRPWILKTDAALMALLAEIAFRASNATAA